MNQGTITFYGDELDEYGMPKPFHNYFVVVNIWLESNKGIASILPMSKEAPVPESLQCLAGPEGEKSAFEKAIEVLENLEGNKGLNKYVKDERDLFGEHTNF